VGFVDTLIVSTSPSTGATSLTGVAYEPGTANLYVIEKGNGNVEGRARVRVRAPTGVVTTALTLGCVDSSGERGVLGIAFSPDYTDPSGQSRFVYLFYTRRFAASGPCSVSGAGVGTKFRVSRFEESTMMLSGERVILEGPFLRGATNHNAGTLRFA